jgi:hypothetical protein
MICEQSCSAGHLAGIWPVAGEGSQILTGEEGDDDKSVHEG